MSSPWNDSATWNENDPWEHEPDSVPVPVRSYASLSNYDFPYTGRPVRRSKRIEDDDDESLLLSLLGD